MKRFKLLLIISLCLCSCSSRKTETSISGCDIFDECGNIAETEGTSFKEIYESLNGAENSSGKSYRVIEIAEDHPFVQTDVKTVLQRIENKESFYLYVGDEMCPWCRSVIEKAIEVSSLYQIKEIAYLEIWDEKGAEILRDKYVVEDGKLILETEAAQGYKQLLECFDELLSEYVLNENDQSYDTGEKRIYAPNFIYIENGIARKLVTGLSDRQQDSLEELSAEILADETAIFEAFFNS